MSAAALRFAFMVGVVLAGSMPAHAWLYHELRDWTVTCSNGLTCTMQASLGDDAPFHALSFERTSAPNAPVDILFDLREGALSDAAEISLSVAGAPSITLGVSEAAEEFEGARLRFAAAAGFMNLVEAMKAGEEMRITVDDGGGQKEATVSLAGVTAALLFIDETQGRLQRTDALQAIGGRGPPAEASVRAITGLEGMPPAVRADFVDETAYCGGLEPERFAALEGFVIDRGDAGLLVALPCGLGGAYNQPYVLYAGATMEAIRPRDFPIIGETGPVGTPMAYNLSYDPSDQAISAFFRGRGLGDCGSYSRWSIDQDGYGLALTLSEQTDKGECDGDYAGGPEEWPAVWPK